MLINKNTVTYIIGINDFPGVCITNLTRINRKRPMRSQQLSQGEVFCKDPRGLVWRDAQFPPCTLSFGSCQIV